GAFLFDHLQPGHYGLQTSHARFQRDVNEAPTIDLRPGSDLAGIRLTMFVPSFITGSVYDEGGQPIQFARVEALQYVRRGNRGVLIERRSGTTEDRGIYRVSDIRPGRAYVRVTFAGDPQSPNSTAGYHPTYFPNAPDLEHAQPLDMAAGSELKGISLVMPR